MIMSPEASAKASEVIVPHAITNWPWMSPWPSPIIVIRLSEAQTHAMVPSKASLARPLVSSIQPCAPNMRLRPDSGLIREALNARLAGTQRP